MAKKAAKTDAAKKPKKPQKTQENKADTAKTAAAPDRANEPKADPEMRELARHHRDTYIKRKAALSKAQRNAIRNLLPMTVVKGAIAALHEMQRNGHREDVDRSTGEIVTGQRAQGSRQGPARPAQSQAQPQPKAEDDSTRFYREAREMGYEVSQANGMLGVQVGGIGKWLSEHPGKTVDDALAELRQLKG